MQRGRHVLLTPRATLWRMDNAKLLDKLRKLHSLESDSALADYYKVDRRVISNFRQREGTPNIQRLIIEDLLKQLNKATSAK